MNLTLTLSKEEHIKYYVMLFAKGLSLTDKEIDLVVDILLERDKLVENNVPEEYVDSILFTKSIETIKSKYKFSAQAFFNYKEALKKKAILIEKDGLYINPMIIPKKELNFKFNIV